MGEIGGANFYISKVQYEYWMYTQLIIDVIPGMGGMFSLEGSKGHVWVSCDTGNRSSNHAICKGDTEIAAVLTLLLDQNHKLTEQNQELLKQNQELVECNRIVTETVERQAKHIVELETRT